MSRPSSTAPSAPSAKRRCQDSRAARTSGTEETREAASPIARSRRRGSESRSAERAEAAPRGRRRIVEVGALVDQGERDGAIEQAGIEMRQPVMQGEALCERALARGGRAVDGDDEGAVSLHGAIIRDHAAAPSSMRAPSASMVGRKLGKLVAIIAPSSTGDGPPRGEAP
jgi:hypothetical protein